MLDRIQTYEDTEVVFNFERTLLIKHGSSFLKLKDIDGELASILTQLLERNRMDVRLGKFKILAIPQHLKFP